ncbi:MULTISPECIES: TIGR03758 family integrating conjugative element protein [Pasteurellaceae]|jgi:integrating conjugative element protein, PFL_4701 family|uniref:TIGR03758 family integrating conjugative element protein n=1 Tax=Pasteurellaceae TaxID=712 RepID=UPI000DAD1916|nr:MULTISPECIES: TIGR03758 family integrating conjugative element protein [Pasteurellaceae]NNI00468.1 TIGR03758 family integrating conjugative element protein [Pasteurella multocida]RDE67386.1 TIGR03758 family integrating conjugative element protein [Aggregatibacter segnis]
MSEPTKSFEIVSGFTPGQLGMLIGGITVALLLLAGAWMLISNYKGLTEGKMDELDFGKYVTRFIVLVLVVLFLIRGANYS